MLEITCPERMEEAKVFAKRRGLEDNLNKQLDYLGSYACQQDPEKTRCSIYKDHAPHSFGFTMKVKVVWRTYTCGGHGGGCGHEWSEKVQFTETPNISGEGTQYCPKCEGRASYSTPQFQNYEYWFNGGLIYFGEGDSGSEYPQLTTRIGKSEEGWSIHT